VPQAHRRNDRVKPTSTGTPIRGPFRECPGSRGSVAALLSGRLPWAGDRHHPDMKRYFMTIPEAVHCLQVPDSQGGESLC